MHSAIAFLKGAVSRGPSPGIRGCYIVKADSIYAYNGVLQAGMPMESGAEFNVPAVELEAALARMKEVTELSFDGSDLLVRGGRLRANIHCDLSEPPDIPATPEAWLPFPSTLPKALKLALPFIGDRNWSQGIRLRSGNVTAVNNTSGVMIDVEDLQLQEEVLLPVSTAEFLASASDAPSEYVEEASALFFRWADGRWLRTQLLTDKMPSAVDTIFAKAGSEAPIAMSDEWREAFADAKALSDGNLTLVAEGFKAERTGSKSDVKFETGLPREHESRWVVDNLEKVLGVASAWAPDRYPEVVCFTAPSLRGVVVGMRK